jgi:serine/threonine-protein kinase HipA
MVEVRQLDQEPIQSFAQRLTDWIADWATYYSADRLASALRLCGPEWPGADRLSVRRLPTPARSGDAEVHHFYRLSSWLAVCALPDRVEKLGQLFLYESEPSFMAAYIRATARLGAWSAHELAAIERLVAPYPVSGRLACLVALLATGVEAVAEAIGHILRDPNLQAERYVAAEALLPVPEWRDEAANLIISSLASDARELRMVSGDIAGTVRVIVEAASDSVRRARAKTLLSSRLHFVRYVSARELALVWGDDEALMVWIDCVANQYVVSLSVGDLSALFDRAQEVPEARAALESVLTNVLAIQDFSSRFAVARWLILRDPSRAAQVFRQIVYSSEYSAEMQIEAAAWLLELPQERADAIEFLIQLAMKADDPSGWTSGMPLLAARAEDPDVLSVLHQLMRSGHKEELRTEAALALVRPESGLQSEVFVYLCNVVVSTVHDGFRIRAAIALRDACRPPAEWRPPLEHLSRSAKRGSSRLTAAKELHDGRRIAQIAERAKNPKVREDAAKALQRLRLHRALLAVGRRRRGIVYFDGTRAGIIEETPQGSRFTYDTAYLARPKALPISPTLPLRPEPYESRGLHPFFENLLPEGWLLDRTCTKLGLDRTDAFGLMLATCADCAGAVEIVPEAA